MSDDDEDELLAVRAVNAHTFCPRLFWLEEKAGLFQHNEHTVQGEAAHKRVSVPGGKLKAPDAGDEPWHARSLWLSSPKLGVSGKLDLAEEGDGGAVLPVDTKKGRPPKEGGLWPADEVQITLQALLLRDAGYRVDEIAAYYRAERRRVRLPLTDEMVARALAEVDAARRTLLSPLAPAPLVDSPKCRGCSLNVLCQPDEVSALTGRAVWEPGEAIRRVVPEASDAQPAYITIPGARVGVKGQSLQVVPPESSDEAKVTIGLSRTSHVALIGTAQMTTQALRACLEAAIPVCFMSTGGRVYGIAQGEESRAVYVRMAQFGAHGGERALAIARVLIADKIANQRTMLRRNGDPEAGTLERMKRLSNECLEVDSPAALLAKEGEGAKRFWQVFSALCGRDDEAFLMTGRTRRPPRDATNAMISFASGLLTRDCLLAVRTAGLDAYLGVYHTPHHGRPSMALDLMEPFRPLVVDSVVLGVIRRGEVTPDGFQHTGQAVAMTAPARKALIVAYERRMSESITHPLFGYRISYRQVLSVQARLLARALTGELDAMPSFRTR